MNVKQITVAVSLLASAAAAMAVDATQWNPPAGQLSRVAVEAELGRAVATGEVDVRNEAYAGYFDKKAPQSTAARSDVKQEVARAQANGELDGRNEAYGGVVQAHPHVAGHAFAWRKPRQAANIAGE